MEGKEIREMQLGTMRFKILVHKSMQREYEIKRRQAAGLAEIVHALKGLVKWHW